jgi:hypothetical protein
MRPEPANTAESDFCSPNQKLSQEAQTTLRLSPFSFVPRHNSSPCFGPPLPPFGSVRRTILAVPAEYIEQIKHFVMAITPLKLSVRIIG